LTYDLTQDPIANSGYSSSSLIPLNFTNVLPQNSIVSIAVLSPDDGSGGGGGTSVPEASTWALMLVGFAGLSFASYRASRRTAIAKA
jgi:hypothetical protein